MNYAVIGLGAMGMGVARSAIRNGISTIGIDLDENKLSDLEAAGASMVNRSANTIADQIDIVHFLVVNAHQIEEVLFRGKLLDVLQPGSLVICSSTISPDDAKRFGNQLEAKGILMLDAPVSGGSVRANEGSITVMASGPEKSFEKAQVLFSAIAGKVYNIGPEIGLGSTVKVIHQLLAGVHIAAGAEAMALAARAGIPLDKMYEVVTNAAGNSWMFENRMKRIVDGDKTVNSAVDIFVKDLGLVDETAKSLNFPIPLARTALNMFVSASNQGYGKEDDSAVIKIF